MAKISNYLKTGAGLLAGTTSLGEAWKAAKASPGGVIGSDGKVKVLKGTAGKASGMFSGSQTTSNSGKSDPYKYDQSNQNNETKKASVNGGQFSFGDISGSSNSGGSGGSGGGSDNSNIIKAIGKGWDNASDEIDSVSKSLKKSKNYISNLGKVKEQYGKALEEYKRKYDEMVSGNKTMIEKNQKAELDDLAQDTRKSVDNANVTLGLLGGSGGSASKMASRAIANSAGKQRASVLTARGDEMSYQNQQAKNAVEEYNLRKRQADEWEKTARKQAMEEYEDAKDALKRLESKKGKWKDEDIAAESDRNLSKLFESLNAIQAKAGNFRANLEAKMAEFGGSVDALEAESINVDAPAELDTPEFSESINFDSEEEQEDWFDPNKQGKRVIKGYDALGNPIYEDDEELAS